MNLLMIQFLVILSAIYFGKTAESKQDEKKPLEIANESVPCIVNGKTGLRGICMPVRKCPSAISDLRSGVKIIRCTHPDASIVCCPSGPRISETMCEKYTEVLKVIERPSPLLPPVFLETSSKAKIHCNPNLNQLIIGGRDSKIGEFPHAVALGYNSTSGKIKWRCGGTLISDQYVLTAAHCVKKNSQVLRPLKILLGDITLSHRTTSSREEIGIKDILVHPMYKTPFTYYDIALIKMDKKVDLNRNILPACLPQPKRNLLKNLKGQNFTAVGWGLLSTGGDQSDVLQAVNLKGFRRKKCDSLYDIIPGKEIKIPDGVSRSQICAGDAKHEKDTCQGDSGGPLTVNLEKRCVHYVVGVTSFGPLECGEKTPGIYTNVQTFLDWIEPIVWGAEISDRIATSDELCP